LISKAEPDEICQQMKNICYERGAEDNLTAVIVKVSSEVVNNYAAVNRADEFEEATIAAVRQPVVSSAVVSPAFSDLDEQPTQDLKFSAEARSYQENFTPSSETAPFEPVQNEYLNSKTTDTPVIIQSVPETTDTKSDNRSGIETDVKEYRIDEKNGGSFLGKLLGSLLLLLAGSVIGAGVYYYLLQRNPPTQPAAVPQITEMKTPNIPFSAFEENRRNVDRNPQQFIAANAANPQDAIDFYLLGRAYLLTADYSKAKEAFTEAKNRLAQTDAVNSKTLANEIAMSLAIINDPFAQNAFEKDILENNAPQNSGNTTNSNASNINAAFNR